ncbi:MAG: cytochrome ubiquinol oxidase subunit I [Ignavibacteria bacterium]|nr:cytochrome ubiquinol oxidase subunit I [Ignavibacteria bacterium]
MEAELLSRLQFAVTIAFHFIFPPISIGLGLMLVIVEWLGWKRNDEEYVKLGKFFSKILAITFAIGVASGLVMVLQFGTNWARYSAFVGDIFGAPLAAEAIFAFFLESTFLGLYIFGRNKVSKGVHWFSILMVTIGATISAFWILVANSWQQTPAGFAIQNLASGEIITDPEFGVGYSPMEHRAILMDFWAAVFNPSTLMRFFHTMVAAFMTGAFLMAGSLAYLIRKNRDTQIALKGLKVSLIVAFIFSISQLFPFGHHHAQDVAKYQPEKFAAIQGLYDSEEGAPLVLFGVLTGDIPPEMKAKISIPGVLSWLATGDVNAKISGLSEIPPENRPPMWMPFVSYHNMVALGSIFIAVSFWGVIQIKRKKLLKSKKFLRLLFWIIPLPVLACQFGWFAAEVGRQPWTVYNLLRTSDSFSATVPNGQVWFTLILFTVIYLIMTFIYIYLMMKELKHGISPHDNESEPADSKGKEVTA